ncbi:MAG: hypothetical protein FWG64_01080 [Firmicutes bacterium]|nr:hypothetical protein [Bacillota bacterium]
MMNIVNLSHRRGAILALLPQIHVMLLKDGQELPNKVFWKQEIGKAIVDINHKWIFALEGVKIVHGFLFYQIGQDKNSLYIDNFIAPSKVLGVAKLLITKFERDDEVRRIQNFYISRNIKKEHREEVLETVGLQDETLYNTKGYQLIGNLTQTLDLLKTRYTT